MEMNADLNQDCFNLMVMPHTVIRSPGFKGEHHRQNSSKDKNQSRTMNNDSHFGTANLTTNMNQTRASSDAGTDQIVDVTRHTKQTCASTKKKPPKIHAKKGTSIVIHSEKANYKQGKAKENADPTKPLSSDRRSTKNMTDKSNTLSLCSSTKNQGRQINRSFSKQPKNLPGLSREDTNPGDHRYSSGKRPDSRGRVRSRSFENTRRSDSRSNSALRRTPKLTNESVEKEISHYF